MDPAKVICPQQCQPNSHECREGLAKMAAPLTAQRASRLIGVSGEQPQGGLVKFAEAPLLPDPG
jgi:hypothetical protein